MSLMVARDGDCQDVVKDISEGGREYIFIENVGRGSFGDVWLVAGGKNRQSFYVMKRIHMEEAMGERYSPSSRPCRRALREAQLLSSLVHPFVVRHKETFVDGRNLCIVMEHARGGDLSKHLDGLRKDRKRLEEREILRMFCQLALAVRHLHLQNIIHRDIKASNVFIFPKDNSGSKVDVKLGDFGIARVLETSHEFASTAIGTPYYLSPEICRQQPYTNKSDIWALGCVLYEMCCLKVPFLSADIRKVTRKILQADMHPLPAHFSPSVKTLVCCLLNPSPQGRPSANDILQMPLLQPQLREVLSEQLGSPQRYPSVCSSMALMSHNAERDRDDSSNIVRHADGTKLRSTSVRNLSQTPKFHRLSQPYLPESHSSASLLNKSEWPHRRCHYQSAAALPGCNTRASSANQWKTKPSVSPAGANENHFQLLTGPDVLREFHERRKAAAETRRRVEREMRHSVLEATQEPPVDHGEAGAPEHSYSGTRPLRREMMQFDEAAHILMGGTRSSCWTRDRHTTLTRHIDNKVKTPRSAPGRRTQLDTGGRIADERAVYSDEEVRQVELREKRVQHFNEFRVYRKMQKQKLRKTMQKRRERKESVETQEHSTPPDIPMESSVADETPVADESEEVAQVIQHSSNEVTTSGIAKEEKEEQPSSGINPPDEVNYRSSPPPEGEEASQQSLCRRRSAEMIPTQMSRAMSATGTICCEMIQKLTALQEAGVDIFADDVELDGGGKDVEPEQAMENLRERDEHSDEEESEEAKRDSEDVRSTLAASTKLNLPKDDVCSSLRKKLTEAIGQDSLTASIWFLQSASSRPLLDMPLPSDRALSSLTPRTMRYLPLVHRLLVIEETSIDFEED